MKKYRIYFDICDDVMSQGMKIQEAETKEKAIEQVMKQVEQEYSVPDWYGNPEKAEIIGNKIVVKHYDKISGNLTREYEITSFYAEEIYICKGTKKVVDMEGREVCIDESMQKLHDYSNKDGWIIYNAPYETDEDGITFYTDYKVDGCVCNIEERLKKWNNSLMRVYAEIVNFNSEQNDPDKKKWKSFVEIIKEHEFEFFDKNGDFLEKALIGDRYIIEMYKELLREEKRRKKGVRK